jgi:hypothetical protein
LPGLFKLGFFTGVRVRTDLDTYFDNIPDRSHIDRWRFIERTIVNQGETIGSAELLFSKARIGNRFVIRLPT